MHEAIVEAALYRDGFIFCNEAAIIAGRSCFDQSLAAVVLDDELVAIDLGDLAFDGHQAPGGHRRDRDRRDRRHLRRRMGNLHRSGTTGRPDGKHDKACDCGRGKVIAAL
jgi:hypothetical protein